MVSHGLVTVPFYLITYPTGATVRIQARSIMAAMTFAQSCGIGCWARPLRDFELDREYIPFAPHANPERK